MAYRIEVVVGSLRLDSFNKQLAQALTKLASAEFTLSLADIGKQPLHSQEYVRRSHNSICATCWPTPRRAASSGSTGRLSQVQPRLFRQHRQHRDRRYPQVLAGLCPPFEVWVEQHVGSK
jgi:phenylacetate-coenzyme A ligase PaaK-like adenylate-forming protein